MSKNRIVKLDLDAHREVKQAVRNPISMFIKFQLKAQRKEDPDFKLSKDYIAEMTEAWSDLPQARQQKYIDYVRLDQKREKSIKKGKNLYKEYLNKKTRKGSDEARVKEMIKRPKAVTPLFSIYVREMRRVTPKLTFSEASTSWKQISEEEKQVFVNLYKEEQARYKEEYKKFTEEKNELRDYGFVLDDKRDE